MLFNYLDNFYTIYLNDILIYLDNKLKHRDYVYKVLLRLYKVGL
jgi:hypothetical protein